MKVPIIVERVIATAPKYIGEGEAVTTEPGVIDLDRVFSIEGRNGKALIRFDDGSTWLISESVQEFMARGFINDTDLGDSDSSDDSSSPGDGKRVAKPVATQSTSLWNLFRGR